MRPLIDEARQLEIIRLVGEEAWRELLDQFCLDAAWILEGLAADRGEESLRRSRHALTGLAANFGFPRFAELSRMAVPAEAGMLGTKLALIRDRPLGHLRLTRHKERGPGSSEPGPHRKVWKRIVLCRQHVDDHEGCRIDDDDLATGQHEIAIVPEPW